MAALLFYLATSSLAGVSDRLVAESRALLASLDAPPTSDFRGAVVGVFSMVSMDLSERAVRDSLRTTWAQHPGVERVAWGAAERSTALRVVFVCGTRPAMLSGKRQRAFDAAAAAVGGGGDHGAAFEKPTREWYSALEQLREENATHGDIVLVDAVENSTNFRKTQAWLAYALAAFPNAEFIARADDDVYIRPSCLEPIVARMPSRALYWGWPAFGAASKPSFHRFPIVAQHDMPPRERLGPPAPRPGHPATASTTVASSSGCEPYANGGFIWISRDVAAAVARRDFYAATAYPFLGEDLFFACFVASATASPSLLHALVGATQAHVHDGAHRRALRGGAAGAMRRTLTSTSTGDRPSALPRWHSRDAGLFAEVVYGHAVGANSVVIHAKNNAKRRFELNFYQGKLQRKISALFAPGGAHAQLVGGGSALPRSAASAWAAKIVGVGEQLRGDRVREDEVFSREPQRLAALTASELSARARARAVAVFVLDCIAPLRSALVEHASTGGVIRGDSPSKAACDDGAAYGSDAGANAATLTAQGLVARGAQAITQLRDLVAAFSDAVAHTRTLFDELSAGHWRDDGAPGACPVPQLDALRGVAPVASMAADEECTWGGRFVRYIDASSVRPFVDELGKATYADVRYYSIAAFDCDPSTAWISPPLRDVRAECSTAHARGRTAVALPQWIGLPSVRPGVGRSSGRRVLRGFSMRAIDVVTGAAVSRSADACDSGSPREWRLEAKLAGSAVSSWAHSASSRARAPVTGWFPVAEGTELRAWACSELRHFAVSEERGIDLNTHTVRLVILSVGSSASSAAPSQCDESFAAIAEIDVAFAAIVDDDSYL